MSEGPPDPGPARGRSRLVDAPEPGFFVIRLVKKGPWVPARICRDFGHWWAEVDGKAMGPKSEEALSADWVLRIWHYGREITEAEYRQKLRQPAAEKPDPRKPVDLRKIRSPF